MYSRKTPSHSLFLDKLATLLITAVGLSVILAVFGMMLFLMQTVLPLGKAESLNSVTYIGESTPNFALYQEKALPVQIGLVSTGTSSCEFFVQVFGKSKRLYTLYPAPVGASWSNLDFKKSFPDLEFVEKKPEGIDLIRCVGLASSKVLLSYRPLETPQGSLSHSPTSSKTSSKLGLFELSLKKHFLSEEELLGVAESTRKQLFKEGLVVSGLEFFARLSSTAPVFQSSPTLNFVQEVSFLEQDLFEDSEEKKQGSYFLTSDFLGASQKIWSFGVSWLDTRKFYWENTVSNEMLGTKATEVKKIVPIPDKEWQGKQIAGVSFFKDSEAWIITKDSKIFRSKIDFAAPNFDRTQFSEPLEVKGFSEISSMSLVYGGNSIFLDDGQGRCGLIDAASWSVRNPLGTAATLKNDASIPPLWIRNCSNSSWAKYAYNDSNRLQLRAHEGGIEGFELTTGRRVFHYTWSEIFTPLGNGVFKNLGANDSIRASQFTFHMTPAGDLVYLNLDGKLFSMEVFSPHLEASLEGLFLPIQYEGYDQSAMIWQSTSGNSDFQSKYSLWPLIWGTIKATLYSLFFAIPLGLLAAIYTSEILDRETRNFVKPALEMMASLPSVVLGYIAAILIAPWVEQRIVSILLIGLFTPFLLYQFGILLSKRSAKHVSARGLYASRRLLGLVLLGFLIAVGALLGFGILIERFAFVGDVKAFLAGGAGIESVLWGILSLPFVVFVLWSIPVTRHVKVYQTVVFVVGPFVSLGIGSVLGVLLDKNDIFGSYSQRNTVIIAIAMGFAIIPIIYSLSEDALTSVPNSLRAASLASGASVWQTTARIVLPTAASGIFSAVMIGLGRGIGETMIAVMATGNSPLLGINPFEGLRSLAANIAVELPEAPHGGTHYRILFLTGLVLLVFTFTLNSLAEYMRSRYRERNKAL